MRTLVLVDGEHYPPVVRAAIDELPSLVPGAVVAGAALLGGEEKLRRDVELDVGVPLVSAATPEEALLAGLERFRPELVVDLADEPVVDPRTRLRLVARVLFAGAAYRGADVEVAPPPRPRVSTKPTVAVIGTGKRTGKTAAAAQLARLLRERGTPPVVVAMGRGGPAQPELIDPATADLTPAALLALSARGRHAASDHVEDAVAAGVATVGTRRCGGGLAGAPFTSTFAAGVALADTRPEPLLVLEGSGSAIPPVHADATVCVVPAHAEAELVTGYLGAYRLLLSDLIVVTMSGESSAVSGARASREGHNPLDRSIRSAVPGVPVVHTVFRPNPLEPVSGRRVFYVTTAPASARDLLVGHLELGHGCTVVGTSHHLANRRKLAEDLEAGLPAADMLLVELKAAAIDLATRIALERGLEVVFCDNRLVSIGGDGAFDELALTTADLAIRRHAGLGGTNRTG